MLSEKTYRRYSREIFMYLDLDNVICEVSDNFYENLKFKKEDVIGKSINYFIIEKSINIQEKYDLKELVLKDKNSEKKYFSVKVTKIYDDSNILIGAYLILFDITEYKNIEHEYTVLKYLADKSYDIIYRVEVYPKLKFTYINDAVEKLLGVTKEQHYEDANILFELIHSDDAKKLQDKINNVSQYRRALELRYINKKGKYIFLEDFSIPEYDKDGRLISFQGISRCIQDRKELESKLQYLSYNDIITGVTNKTYFTKEMRRLNKNGTNMVTIIILDLDGLKNANDEYGHLIGDELIIAAANILKEVFDEESTISRIGGDEFAVIVNNASEVYIKEKFKVLDEKIEKYNYEEKIKISISKGYSIYKDFNKDIKLTIDEADYKMYQDKNSKKNY